MWLHNGAESEVAELENPVLSEEDFPDIRVSQLLPKPEKEQNQLTVGGFEVAVVHPDMLPRHADITACRILWMIFSVMASEKSQADLVNDRPDVNQWDLLACSRVFGDIICQVASCTEFHHAAKRQKRIYLGG